MTLHKTLKAFWADDTGATAVEYAIVLSVLSIIIILAMVPVGKQTTNTWNHVSNTLENTN